MNFELFELILSAISQAFIISQANAYNKEIIDGGTKNRIWSFLSIAVLIPYSLSPLGKLFPASDFSIFSYGAMAFSAGLYYVASVAHQNQIYINQGEPDRIERLPYDLHENEYLTQAALWLSAYMAPLLLTLYVSTLVSCIFLGAPMYAYVSLAMYAVNLLNQHDYIPEYLKPPFMYFNIMVSILTVFGISNWLNASITLFMLGVTVFDYIRCNWLNIDSPTLQFPMANHTHQLMLSPEDDLNPSTALNKQITQHIDYKTRSDLHVSFDHFYRSHQVTARILEEIPQVDFNNYKLFFDQCNFQSQAFQELISNQMSVHDKYNQASQQSRLAEFNLPTHASPIDAQIAFLKREMSIFVERLKNPSYRDLNHLQVTAMHRYARLILNRIQQQARGERRDELLLSIALTTGSHCNRAYLESLSAMAGDCNFLSSDTLNLRDQAALQAQTAREASFRAYYYKTAKKLKELVPEFYGVMWQDLDDYHTYEDFVEIFGRNFYMRNPSLNQRIRTIFDIFHDRYNYYLLTWAQALLDIEELNMLFSKDYTASYLINQVIHPEGKLHLLFIAWCERHYPSSYKDVVYDEYHLLNEGPEIQALAELMLLDLNILDLDAPELHTAAITIEATNELTNMAYGLNVFSLFSTPTTDSTPLADIKQQSNSM